MFSTKIDHSGQHCVVIITGLLPIHSKGGKSKPKLKYVMIRNTLKRLSLSYKIMAWNTACRNSDLLCKDFAWIQMIL